MSKAITQHLWIGVASTGLLLLSGSAVAQSSTAPHNAPAPMPCPNAPMQGEMMQGGMMQGDQMPGKMGQGSMMGGQMMNMQDMRADMRALHDEIVQLRAELKKHK
ncbi:MAG: hypothetical protein JJE34_09280 [Alphaproteobacteria bacterium]|nr:hypothetical protein [Alphaproteobacteria bacterium]